MKNQTMISSVLLMSLSENQKTIYFLFIVFLLIYLMTFLTNCLIILLVLTCAHLHTPMYFFLGNLAFLDMSYSSVTAPRMLFYLTTQHWSISFSDCIAQMFFVMYFACSEAILLSSMSYDRYVAICRPLHYSQVMSWRTCTQMVSLVWSTAFFASMIDILCLRRLTFCGPNFIQNFFCDLPHLLQISCTDTSINVLVLRVVGGPLSVAAFVATFYPYVRIFSTVFKIRTSNGKRKAFSTCTSHLTVVFIFYASITFIYFVPNTSNLLTLNQVVTVIYTLITPLLNPLIYSLRSKDLKVALRRTLHLDLLIPDLGTRRRT
ncbi:olfactory receptor 1468-like [Bufo gargarizans]|uniref:olfactory receptor 1468-like n=1 Tax=Bufo gargarizans TaxID=30331 RepID=UPI001CF58D06|nr:olfactory receptor 1468-like [Bufo gargarizans]